MIIGILSDSHDNRETLSQVLNKMLAAKVSTILHCGDVVAASTLKKIAQTEIPLHVIHGNNLGDLVTFARVAANYPNIKYYGQDADLTLNGKRIFLVHYPHYAEAIATTGKYDLVCCGHSHIASINTIANIKQETTYLINAGNTAGIGEEPKYVLGDLNTMQFTIYNLRD